MSTGDGIPFKSQNPIQVHSCQKNFNLKFCENERNLLVYWNEEVFIENSTQEKSNVIICHLEGYSLDNLVFTGSEFDNVVLVAGRNIDTTSQEFLIVLYKIISRARKTLKVFSHPSNLAEFESLLTLSDTDVYFDKQRYDNNLSAITLSNISSLKKYDSRHLEPLEVDKYIVAMMVQDEDPQSLYNKAFVEYLNADLKMVHQLLTLAISFVNPSRSQFNHANFVRLATGGIQYNDLFQFLPFNRIEFVDFVCELIDGGFPNAAEPFGPIYSELGTHCNKFFQEVSQSTEIPNYFIRIISENQLVKKIYVAFTLLNSEEIRQFLDQQSISSKTLFTKIGGFFLVLAVLFSNFNPDQFIEFLKSVGVDSLKMSEEQFLDDERNNILMYCVSKTRSFYMVAERALKQGYLDEL